jgi:hypothetical protein
MKDKFYPDAQQILDYFCLNEHISDFVKVIFYNQEDKYQPWVE